MTYAMKLRFGLMSIVILASIWILPTELADAEPSGDPPRVIVSLVLLDAPSGLQTTTDLGSLGTIISHQSLLTPGDMVFLEAWCRTPGPHGITTAVIDVTYQTTFLNTSAAQVSLAQQWAGVLPFTVSVDDEAGVIDDLGGNNFSGLGAGEWARIGTIEFDVTGTPADPVQFCSLFAGETPDGIPLEFAIWSEGGVDPSDVAYGCYWVGCSVDANCHDGDACTDDYCDPDLGCLHSATDCDDGNVCTVDTCDPVTGCDNDGTGITIACDDGDACTTGDVCQGEAAGTCAGTDTSATDCDDGNVCTVDTCDPSTGCDNDGTGVTDSCDDNNTCTTNDVCQGDAAGTCEGTDTSATDCDDGNVCTDDSCDPITGCLHVDNTDPCDDGDACTTNDTCSDGACVGGPPLDCDDQNVCTDDSCDPATGCAHVDNTGPCDDGDACTTHDMCSDGTCVGGPPLDCDDQNVCTDDSCDPATGCVYVNNTDPCDDGDACTTNDTCSGGTCVSGPPLDCDDQNVCTDDSCDPASGCVHAPLDCDDGNQCTDDSCDPEIGCLYTPVDGHPEMIIVEIPGLTGAYDWDIQRDAEVSLGFSLFEIGCVAIQWAGWINTGTFDCFGTLQGLGGQFVATFIPESFAGASFEELDERANFTIPFDRTDPVQLQSGGTFDFILDGSADIRVSFPPYSQECPMVYSPIGMLNSVSLVIAAHRMHDFDADGAVDLDDMNAFDSCMGGPEDQLAIGCEVFDSDRDVDVDLADFAAFQVEFTGEP